MTPQSTASTRHSTTDTPAVFPGADEATPSLAHYFSWINHEDEGATEDQSMANLAFFRWLQEEFGLVLDIYAFDEGTIDGRSRYEDMEMTKKRFPDGFARVNAISKAIGTRLGMWLGPDGFGDSAAQQQSRAEMIIDFCRQHQFILFKFDAVCGQLRPEMQEFFRDMLVACRKFCPDLIVLNHRLDFGVATPHATTSLWEGAETYIDVHMTNRITGTHNRVAALSRGLPPGLTRLVEDHGVCLSSCLDYWDDDLVLQAFNRGMILAPEIYGNPWFLRDDEMPKLARIFNLHRSYREILAHGMKLPEDQYGPNAVSRGDDATRFLTLRNLTWNPVKYKVRLDAGIGLAASGEVTLRQFHPVEKDLGTFPHGSEVAIEVEPFRSLLVTATIRPLTEVGVSGCAYEVTRNVPGKPVELRLLGRPGTQAAVRLLPGTQTFTDAYIAGKPVPALTAGGTVTVDFPGEELHEPSHRQLGVLDPVDVPEDAEALYEATCFSSTNNALEYQCLTRSGTTSIPQVQAARDAFFQKPDLKDRMACDRFLFDGDAGTMFQIRDGTLRLDFCELLAIDRLVLTLVEAGSTPLRAEVSSDLTRWIPATISQDNHTITIAMPADETVLRYVRLHGTLKIRDVQGYGGNALLDRSLWRASSLFQEYASGPASAAWTGTFALAEVPPAGSYLCIALEGRHGKEGACAALRVNGTPQGAPTRAPSMPFVPWESGGSPDNDSNYTYFVPVSREMTEGPFDVVVLTVNGGLNEYVPHVWITAQSPLVARELTLT